MGHGRGYDRDFREIASTGGAWFSPGVPKTSDQQVMRLITATYLGLGALVFIATVTGSRFVAFSPPAYVFYATLAVYTAFGLGKWPLDEHLGRARLFVLVQVALFALLHWMRVPSSYLYLLAMPVVSHAASHFRWPGTTVVVVAYLAIMAWFFQNGHPTWENTLSIVASMAAAFLFVILFTRLAMVALTAKDRASQLAGELEAANARLREQSTQTAALAAANERNRIARDIHDGLGHYLTVIAVQLEAAGAVLEREPARAREAIRNAETLAREALAEVRRSVGALRNASAGPALSDALRGLLNESGAAAELTVQGSMRTLPTPIEQTLFRTVQEGLTNARKHARAKHIEVVLQFGQADGTQAFTAVEVNDDGVGAAARDGASPGYGLVGLRERVEAVGGKLHAGNRPSGGFQLRVEVPA